MELGEGLREPKPTSFKKNYHFITFPNLKSPFTSILSSVLCTCCVLYSSVILETIPQRGACALPVSNVVSIYVLGKFRK